MMQRHEIQWFRRALVSLSLVAFFGVLMRYKMAFSLPFLDQKHMQEAHSHFAFYGWITQMLYLLIYQYLLKFKPQTALQIYPKIINLNYILALMMLVGFLWGGYFWLTIGISTLSLSLSFVMFFLVYRDLKGIKDLAKPWLLGGLFFAMFSALGIFSLSYMMASGHIHQQWYLASTYYYLHFQYNGFFLMSCIGWLIAQLTSKGISLTPKQNRRLFRLMFWGCLLGYGLSVLWLDLPWWLFIIVLIASLTQTLGAFQILTWVRRNWHLVKKHFSPLYRWMLCYAGVAFAIKIGLQLGSNSPAISQFAFGFRNIVIAYLHLILLMCISVFLLAQIFSKGYFKATQLQRYSIISFLIFVFLNELILGSMGIFSIRYVSIPYAAEALVIISLGILLSVLMILKSTYHLNKRD
ncbi:hypothetical protein [Riemerella columbina]|uniref:hypothetical protein n=1 Tax=Riemerella columbina TaxID=103810 RepID=UPI00266F6CAE|nr:hypothetical protein [Riemerella columbina]WKS94427.1 hypothetical protein NYR17_05635 [Riemerella columbina]